MFLFEGRTVGWRGKNVVVLDVLGKSGNVIIEGAGGMRWMVHRSELSGRIPKRCLK